MDWAREVAGRVRLYVCGLPRRLRNGWFGDDPAVGTLSPRIVLERGRSGGDPWELAAELRGRGPYSEVRYLAPGESGPGTIPEITDVTQGRPA